MINDPSPHFKPQIGHTRVKLGEVRVLLIVFVDHDCVRWRRNVTFPSKCVTKVINDPSPHFKAQIGHTHVELGEVRVVLTVYGYCLLLRFLRKRRDTNHMF